MRNNITKILILILVITFFVSTYTYYTSQKNINLIKENRENLEIKRSNQISKLPILENDTNNVIEFNSEFKRSNEKNFKRSFWELFK